MAATLLLMEMRTMKKLLVVVDMQNDFIDGSLGTPNAQGIVASVAKVIGAYASRGDDIVFTRDTHHEDYLHTQEGKKLPVLHCIEGSHGWQICDKLNTKGHTILNKPTFGSKELGKLVVELAPDSVELVGLCTDICVISNAMIIKAFCPELSISVKESCCAGVTPQSHENALMAMRVCQIDIV